jgi:uncharacterized protein (DUF433 family)
VNLRELAESRIVIDEEVCSGKPRIKGTRVTVGDIMLSLAEGLSQPEILRNFRSLQALDIQAAIAYSFCISENIKLRISSSFGGLNSGELIEELGEVEKQNDLFSKILEEQAAIQEEITKEKVAQIQARKLQKSKAPVIQKREPPKERPYDLLIDISGEDLTKIFSEAENIEQGLDMTMDNYVFELRTDGKQWLTYSVHDGIEIDQAMRRNLLVTYKDTNGQIKEGVFEGYLTTDRQHKVFLQRTEDGETCGKAL